MPKATQMSSEIINSKQTPQTNQQSTQLIEDENEEEVEESTQVRNKRGRKPDTEEVKKAKV